MMNKSKSKNDKSTSNMFSRYKSIFIVSVLVMIIVFLIIYFIFSHSCFIPAGHNLSRKDWLSFIGSYLSFAGTFFVGMIAVLQSMYYAERENERMEHNRMKMIQPIFSIDIQSINSQIDGVAEVINIWKNSAPTNKHENITISIENVGQFPIKNVIVFDNYISQLLNCKERKMIQVAYSDTDDAKKYSDRLLILDDTYDKDEQGIPKWFNINYEDIDGHEMFQTFVLKTYDNRKYYSLDEICELEYERKPIIKL